LFSYLVLISREIIRALYYARHTAVEIRPSGVVGRVHGKREAGLVAEFEVDLTVLARIDGVGTRADGGGEFAVEV
jgi:hypothetical protein